VNAQRIVRPDAVTSHDWACLLLLGVPEWIVPGTAADEEHRRGGDP
jgi:hypothetical protein